MAKNGQVIIDFFVKSEMNRQIALLKQKHSDVISAKVGSMFDSDVWVIQNFPTTRWERTLYGLLPTVPQRI